MSFELFHNGKPILVNCGTYAYQSDKRAFFRSTAAHNTVMVKGIEQSQCWGAFRVGKASSVRVIESCDTCLVLELKDQIGNVIKRSISISDDECHICDTAMGKCLQAYYHTQDCIFLPQVCEGEASFEDMLYSPDYGNYDSVRTLKVEGMDRISVSFPLLIK